MATQRKLIDLTGAPFVIEKREDGKWYIVGVKVRKREFIFESTGLPVEIVDKITGTTGNDKVDGIEEIEQFLEDQEEGSKLSDIVPSEYASDDDMKQAWQEAMSNAMAKAQENNS